MGKPSIHVLYSQAYSRAAKEYRDYLLLLGYKAHTCQSRYRNLKEFFSWLEKANIYTFEQITTAEIARFNEYLENRQNLCTGKPLGIRAIYNSMRSLQVYLGYLLDTGLITVNPASYLKLNYPAGAARRIIFTRSQINELYQSVQTSQERAILNMAYGCGLRVGELVALEPDDLKLTENIVIVQKGKNNKRRLIPMGNRLSQEMRIYLDEIREQGKKTMFTNCKGRRMQQWTFNSVLKQIIRRTGFGRELSPGELAGVGIHSLRHSIATHLLQNGMKLKQVQTFLGHSHIESTEVYTHVSQNQINNLIL